MYSMICFYVELSAWVESKKQKLIKIVLLTCLWLHQVEAITPTKTWIFRPFNELVYVTIL
jgi:hypothetical protein